MKNRPVRFRKVAEGQDRRDTAGQKIANAVANVSRSYTATEAKHEFGHVLEQAIRGDTVVITKHDAPRAILISIDKFEALRQAPQIRLNTLSEQFDALLERMQTPGARRGMTNAFNASSKQLGKAAVAATRKRG